MGECLSRLKGMYAFAVWDAREEKLFLARDPFGIKPLYYHTNGVGELLFASEISALLVSRTFQVEVDTSSVSDYLSWLSVPSPRTIYQNILSLSPGECATFKDGKLAVHRHWTFPVPNIWPGCQHSS